MADGAVGFLRRCPDFREFQGLAFLKLTLRRSRAIKGRAAHSVKRLPSFASRLFQNLRRPAPGEENYRRLAEAAADMITRHGAKGEVEYASPAAAELTGVSPIELLGAGLLERVHIADRPAYLAALSQAFNAAAPTTAEFRLRRSAGADGNAADRFLWV